MSAASFKDLVGPIYVINLKHRSDRWAECISELAALQMAPTDVTKFDAIGSAIHGSIGCAYSHASVLLQFLVESSAPHCLILEDDFHPIRDVDSLCNDLDTFFAAEKGWEVLLLSGNEVLAFVTENPCYVNVTLSQTTSAYVIRRHAIPKLINKLLFGAEKLKSLLPVLPHAHWMKVISLFSADMIWKDLQKEGGWFMLNPKPMVQRPSFSDIWQRHADYQA